MREGASGVERAGRWRPRAVLLLAGIAVAVSGTSIGARGLATVIVLLAAVLLVPFTLQHIARYVGGATARLARGTGPIAVLHLVKERSRSAYTLALVMVVLAMLITVAGANAAMSDTLTRIIDRQAGGSLQVVAPGAFDPDVGARLAEVEGAEAVTPIRFGQTDRLTHDGSRRVDVTVIEPETYVRGRRVRLGGRRRRERVCRARGRGAVLLPDGTAAGEGVGRGDVVPLRTSGGIEELIVAGTYELLIDTPASTKSFAFDQLRGFFSLAYVILVAAAVAGMLGLANTLAVSVLARTHEIGVLRSAGTLRRQIRQMVLVEAVTLALAAFVLALPLGLLLSLGTAGAFRGAIGASIELTLPWAFLPPLLVATLVVASPRVDRPRTARAGRLEPVAALRFD